MLANSRVTAIVPVVDLERAKAFYEEKLGLQSGKKSGNMIEFTCGQGTLLTLYQRETPTKADHTAVVWIVDNLEDVVQGLREKGIVFEQYDMPGLKTDENGIANMEGGKGAWFKDTEGNLIGLASEENQVTD